MDQSIWKLDNGTSIKRINRTTARKLYTAKKLIYACKDGYRPNNMWQPAHPLVDTEDSAMFEQMENAFLYYNGGCRVAYYAEVPK